jgi:hypothetical protein
VQPGRMGHDRLDGPPFGVGHVGGVAGCPDRVIGSVTVPAGRA